MLARVNHCSHANTRAHVELTHTGTNGHNLSSQLVAYDLRIVDIAPVAGDRVNGRMTNCTIVNLHCDVFRAKNATLELQRFEWTRHRISLRTRHRSRAVIVA